MIKWGLGLAVTFGLTGLTGTAQAATGNTLVTQKNVTKFGQVVSRHNSKLYRFSATTDGLQMTATQTVKASNVTGWVVSKTALVNQNGTNYRYYYVTPANAHQPAGWLWHGDLKTPTRVALNAPFVDQNAVKAWMGCESASLLEGLQSKGVLQKTGLVAFMKHLPRSKNNNPNNGFAGSPYKVTPGVFQSIFPKPLAKWGNQYHAVKNISGASTATLRKQLRLHNPVVVYVTLHFQKAQWGHYFWGNGINNSHVMLLDGYDTKKKQYHVADPNHGKYWVSAKKFNRSYNYKHYAVAVQ